MPPQNQRPRKKLIQYSNLLCPKTSLCHQYSRENPQKPKNQSSMLGFTSYRIENIKKLTDSAIEMRFAIPPKPDGTPADIGIECSGSMMFLTRGGILSAPLIRKYTPLDCKQVGYADYLIKIYPDGRGTQWIAGLKVGDTVSMRAHPKKDIDIVAAGRPVVMVAGGSGIAPMIQILNHFRRDTSKFTSLTLYFGGLTEQDLYYKELIDDLAAKHADKLKVVYSLENPADTWTGSKGYTNVELIQSLLPAQDTNPLIIVSGPPRMMVEMVGEKKLKKQGVLGGLLGKLGYTRKSLWTLW